VIEAHLAEGNVSDALHHYERFRALLDAELDVPPSTQPVAIMQTAEPAINRLPAFQSS
jgi:DNA-binding SARP family transcriptional activator